MNHPDIERMMNTGLKPFEKYWYDTEEESDPWLMDRADDSEDE